MKENRFEIVKNARSFIIPWIFFAERWGCYMIKILDVFSPIVSNYPPTGHALSILQAKTECKDWIFNNFIQLFTPGNDYIDFFDFDIGNCPFLLYAEIDRTWFGDKYDIIEYIRKMINDDVYVYLNLDVSKISAYEMNGIHNPMLYGYNDEKRELYFGDHCRNGKYSFESCSYEEFISAYYFDEEMIGKGRQWRGGQRLRLLRYDNTMQQYYVDLSQDYDNRFCISRQRVKDSIDDYLSGRPTVNWHTRMQYVSGMEKEKHLWGINVYQKLIEIVNEAYDINNGWHRGCINDLYTVYAHKYLMDMRFQLIDFNHSDLYRGKLLKLEKKAQIILNTHLKNCFTMLNGEKKKRLLEDIYTLKEMEIDVYTGILEDL